MCSVDMGWPRTPSSQVSRRRPSQRGPPMTSSSSSFGAYLPHSQPVVPSAFADGPHWTQPASQLLPLRQPPRYNSTLQGQGDPSCRLPWPCGFTTSALGLVRLSHRIPCFRLGRASHFGQSCPPASWRNRYLPCIRSGRTLACCQQARTIILVTFTGQ